MKKYIKYLSVLIAVVMLASNLPLVSYAFNNTIETDLTTAKNFIDYMTVNSNTNKPATVTSTYGSQFSWDNEKRESANKSYLFEWSYYNGVVFEGLEYIYDFLGTQTYRNYVEAYMNAMISSSGTWAKCTSGNTSKDAAGYVDYHGADCYKTASLLLDMCRNSNGTINTSSKYYTMATTLYRDLTTGTGSNYCKADLGYNYWHSGWNGTAPSYKVWLDGIYMIQPFMAEYAYYTNDTAQLDKIVSRFNWYYTNGRENGTHLYYHAINSSSSYVDFHWTRGIGWYAMAMVDVMQYMSGDRLNTMKTILKDLIDTMLNYQDSSTGMWANLCDANVTSTNRLETSGTAMLAYTIAKAVNKGWISWDYAQYAKKAFQGMVENKLSNNNLSDIYFKASASGSNNYETASNYYTNEGKGFGPFIMAYAQVLQLVDTENNPPIVEVIDAPSGIKAESLDLTGITVSDVTATSGAFSDRRFKAYDISLAGYTQGNEVTVSIPLPSNFTASKTKAYYINNGSAQLIESEAADGYVTFETNHMSVYAIAESDSSWIYIPSLDNYYAIAGTNAYAIDGVEDIDLNEVKNDLSIIYKNTLTANASTLAWTDTNITTEWDTDPAVNPDLDSYTLTIKVAGTTVGTVQFDCGSWIEISRTGTVETLSPVTIYVLENSGFSNNVPYLFLTNDEKNVMAPASSSVGRATVTTKNAGSTSYFNSDGTAYSAPRKYLDGTSTLANYEFTKDSSNKIYNSATSRYLAKNSANNGITMSTSGSTWTASFTASGPYVRLSTNASGTKYIRYERNAYSLNATQNNNNNNIRLYKKTTVYTKTTTQVTAESSYARLAGNSGVQLNIGDEYTETDLRGTFNVLYKDTADSETVTFAGTNSRVTLVWNKELDTSEEDLYTATIYFDNAELGSVAVNVVERELIFPEPGAVKIDKNADGENLADTGIAEVSLSAMTASTKKPVDVLFITDLSNSMNWVAGTKNNAEEGETSKLADMQYAVESFSNVLLENNIAGDNRNNTVSFVSFAGLDHQHEKNTSNVSNWSTYCDPTRTLFTSYDDKDAVVAAVNNIRFSGSEPCLTFDGSVGSSSHDVNYGNTNYDYAFMEGYSAVNQIKADYLAKTGQNYDDSDREIYILFVTDGAPTNYNGEYYNTKTDSNRPDNNATWTNQNGQEVAYDRYVSGTTTYTQSSWYNYICNTDSYWATRVYDMTKVADMAVCGIDLDYGGFSSWVFSQDEGAYNLKDFVESIVAESSIAAKHPEKEERVLRTLFSSDAETLAANLIDATQALSGAKDTYVIDTLGDAYSVQMASTVANGTITLADFGITPNITVKSYPTYHLLEVGETIDGVTVTTAMVGERKSDTPVIQERVTFNDAGTEAYSTLLTGNIMTNGIIRAKNFIYNSTNSDYTYQKSADVSIVVPARSFYWEIGMIPENETMISYTAYLDGSLEGMTDSGVYATNRYASINYVNSKGKNRSAVFPVPELEWSNGTLGYELYYVNLDGAPISVNGEEVSFADRVTVSNSVVSMNVSNGSTTVIGDDQLNILVPDGYVLYNYDATYTVVAGTSAKVTDSTGTTKIYYDNAGSSVVANTDANGYATGIGNINTLKAAFAIVAIAIPDATVVIDYGLPVTIHTIPAADAAVFGGGISAVSATLADNTTLNTKGYADSRFTGGKTSATLSHGGIAVGQGNTAVYTPTDMMMSAKETVYYEYTTGGGLHYYATITVVPATIMYYEDNKGFITYNDTTYNKWQIATGTAGGSSQAESRPGVDDIMAAYDEDNVYGFDASNSECNMYSLGAAHYVNVKNGDYQKNGGSWPTAQFTFTGTAFDLIGMSSATTGFITMMVYQGNTATGTIYKRWIVDTYYGFSRELNGYVKHEWSYKWGSWHVHNTIVEEMDEIPESQKLPSNLDNADPEKTYITYELNYTWSSGRSDNALYQIPVLRSSELPYGTYTVVIQPSYATMFDHSSAVDPATGKKDYTNGNYDFYLDAIRTYAPVSAYEDYNNEYYALDGEGWPQFLEIRDNIINAVDVAGGETEISGAVFIDSVAAGTDITDYISYGPNNEVYLAPGQSIAFALSADDNGKLVDTVQLSCKKLSGDDVTIEVNSVNDDGTLATPNDIDIVASSDMYYKVCEDIGWDGLSSNSIIVTNISEYGYVSLTRIKLTFKDEPQAMVTFMMPAETLNLTMSVAKQAYIASISECYHEYEYTIKTAPTATETGVITAHCGCCGDSFEIIAPVLGGTDYTIVSSEEATDDKDGKVVYSWNNGEITVTEIIPATGTPEVIAPAGNEDGNDAENLTVIERIIAFFNRLIAFINSVFG